MNQSKKIIIRTTVRIILFLILLTPNLHALQTEAQNISSDKYFQATLSELNTAKSSILLVMYLISISPNQPDSAPAQLVNALIKAKERGVAVKVILDQNINFESESTDEAIGQNKNQKAYELLTKNNIPVFYDTPNTYTHSKIIIIDNETIILGSTNWSKAALTRNNESNVLIRSKELAQEYLNDLNKITLQENIPAFLTPSVSISKDILNKKTLSQMASASDERAFDTYLYLLKEYDQNKDHTVSLNYEYLATSLGINNMSTEDYRRQITKTLEKLDNKYHLIKFTKPERNQNTQIKLILSSLSESLSIPTTYWSYHYNQSLSLPAKVMYLINLTHTQESPNQSFSISRENLSKLYNLSESFISQGNQDLRKLNILDIKYSELEAQRFNQRQPNTYTLQDLYNPEDLKKDLDKLATRYDKDKLNRAVSTASLVFEQNNIKTIQTLIDLENQYGMQTIEEAKQRIADKNPDNPKRSAGYLINTIKALGSNKNS